MRLESSTSPLPWCTALMLSKPVSGFRLSKDEFLHTRKEDVEVVKLSEAQGGGTLGSLEVFHQLHCVVCPSCITEYQCWTVSRSRQYPRERYSQIHQKRTDKAQRTWFADTPTRNTTPIVPLPLATLQKCFVSTSVSRLYDFDDA